MAEKLSKGLFITFEGPEGSGKSTHSRRLSGELEKEGFDIVHTAEPGGTPLGARIRNILLDKDDIRLDSQAELFLFEADRAQHVEELIKPALDQGKIVLCDRFNTATFAYQGYGLGMDMDLIENMDRAAVGSLQPDLTILMDVDVGTGLQRAAAAHSKDRMEKRAKEFHEKVREGYLALAEKDPDRIKVIEVKDDIEQTYSLVKEQIDGLIERYKGAG
ncbi:dTMP kinase [Candidatus Omnitrophota bacterium]